MSHVVELIHALFPRSTPQRTRDDAYLAAAVDPADFERRLQALEQRGRRATPALTYSLGLR
jgi:Protein of unknown function (DUF3563)